MNQNNSIVEYNCKSVDDFWDLLSPLNPTFEGHALFRGQADASWPLVPTLLRSKGKFRSGIPEHATPIEFIELEIRLLGYFLNSCDRGALAVPNDSMELRDTFTESGRSNLVDRIKSGSCTWPYDYLLSIFSLAQHYGVSTRLLDWTERSYIAAYFAAVPVLMGNANSKEIAVWRLQRNSSHQEIDGCQTKIIRPPSGVNANIAAQSGCFTVIQYRTTDTKKIINPICLSRQLYPSELTKITLSSSECKLLLMRCNLFGINAITLQPGFYGAAKSAMQMFRTRAEDYIVTT